VIHDGKVMIRHVRIGGRRLAYALRFRATRHLTISVHPDLTVTVSAPHEADVSEVDRRVERRASWVHRHLRELETYHPLPAPRRYVSGETHLYLGRQYRLRVRRGAESVSLSGGFLLVTTRDQRKVEGLVKHWYRGRAQEVFPRRLKGLTNNASWLNGIDHSLRVREMPYRWGSCGPAGVITLNVDLVKAPPSCIDYILAHELCHRLDMSHSRRFYALLARAVPGWEKARERLNRALR
jgi:predicted metal-dependent hydrolase